MKNVSIITVADSEITFDTKIVTEIVMEGSHGREKTYVSHIALKRIL